MLALPSSDWSEAPEIAEPPVSARWKNQGEVRHVFTHFSLKLDVLVADACSQRLPEGFWAAETELRGLPTVFAKAAALAGLSAGKRR